VLTTTCAEQQNINGVIHKYSSLLIQRLWDTSNANSAFSKMFFKLRGSKSFCNTFCIIFVGFKRLFEMLFYAFLAT
jgi:hypothetical protein